MNVPAADSTMQDPPGGPAPDEPDSSPTGSGSPPRDRSISVQTVNYTKTQSPVPEGWFEQHLSRAAELAGVKSAGLSVVIVGDDDMAVLHKKYTGVSGTTDVLTFDMADVVPEDSETIADIAGDIIVCLDEARRQAERRGHPAHHELLLYAVHGLLHLLGEDDHDNDSYQRMHAREDALLEQLGIGRLFNPNPQPPGPKP